MSCFFCDSDYHVSHNCDKFKSDESRKGYIVLKNCCPICLVSLNANKCEKCEINRKCFICFKRDHHTVFCPDRFERTNMFTPNINKDLLFRYVKLLKLEEICLMIFSFPVLFDSIKMAPLKVIYRKKISFASFQVFKDYDFVVADTIMALNSPGGNTEFSPLKLSIFHVKQLEIQRSQLSSQELLQLLSTKTKILNCGNTKFEPSLSLNEIIKKASKLEVINISNTNVVAHNTWLNDLLQMDCIETLQYLSVQIPDLNFDVKKLSVLMKTAKDVKICLYTSLPQEEFELMKRRFFEYFTFQDYESMHCINIKNSTGFGWYGRNEYTCFLELKDS